MERILAATDRSETADRAVLWAAEMARRYAAELVVVQIVAPGAETEGVGDELERYAAGLGTERARSSVVTSDDPSRAIVDAAEAEDADVIVVGNVGMSGRKEFLLGNVPNRVSHLSRRTVVIVNTAVEERKRWWKRD